MQEASVDPELCDGCQDCVEECVYDAIDLVSWARTRRLKASVDPDRCCGCQACAQVCPPHGITMRWLGRPRR